MSWNDEIEHKAESLILGSVQINKTPDTLTDSTDRSTLSKSTLGAFEAPSPGVDLKGLKLKASSQLLESFVGNETADMFDTIQHRELNFCGNRNHGAEGKKCNITIQLDSCKIFCAWQSSWGCANFDREMAKASKSAQGANEEAHATLQQQYYWSNLGRIGVKAKAPELLGSIRQSTKSSSNSAQLLIMKPANLRGFFPLLRKFFDPKCSRMGGFRVLPVIQWAICIFGFVSRMVGWAHTTLLQNNLERACLTRDARSTEINYLTVWRALWNRKEDSMCNRNLVASEADIFSWLLV